MPDQLTDEEISSILGIRISPEAKAATTTATATGLGPPIGTQPEKLTAEQRFIKANDRGIPIDLSLEPAKNVRSGVLLRENPEDKIKFLEGFFGQGNARIANDGQPLVTVWDEHRKTPVEMPALGWGFQPEDIEAHAVSLIPETLGALAGAKAGGAIKARRFFRFAAEAIGAAVGQETGGAAKDIAVSGTPLTDIVQERASRIPATAAVNVGLGAGVKAAGRLISPFGGRVGEQEIDLDTAVRYAKDKFGIEYPITSGDRIGSRIFKRVEATLSREPGASEHFDKLQRQRVEAFRQLQSKMLSSKIDATDIGMLRKLEEDIGEDAIDALAAGMAPAQKAAQLAQNQTAKAINQTIMDELATAVGPVRQMYPEQVGAGLRTGGFSRKAAFDAEASRLYAAADAAGASEKILAPPSLAADAKALLEKLPAPEVTTTSASPILGPTGQPILQTTTGKELAKEFITSDVLSDLQKLSSYDEATKFSLQDLVKMRTNVRDKINQASAIHGVKDHFLGKIEDILTKAINESTDALPDTTLKQAWQTANDFYAKGAPGFAKGAGAFQEKNIARLFKSEEGAGYVHDEDIVRNIGPGEYNSFKEFFGEKSPEFKSLQRGMVDDLLIRSSPGAGDVLDAKALFSNLERFIDKNRSGAEDILGKDRIQQLFAISKLAKLAEEGAKIDRADFQQALLSSRNISKSVAELTAAQRELDKLYRSQILKDIADGKLGQTFNSTEFVNRFYKDASPKELELIKAQLSGNPRIWEDLQRKVAERVFFDAQQQAAAIEGTRLAKGAPFRRTSPSSLEAVFGSEQNKERLKVILGADKIEGFEMLAKLLRSGEASERAFAGAGGWSSQMQVASMFRGGVFSYLSAWLGQKLSAAMYFNSGVEKLLTNQLGRSSELARMVMVSQPMLEALTDDFGADHVNKIINAALDSIDRYEREGPPNQATLQKQQWVDQLIQSNRPKQKVFPAERK